MFPVMRIYSGRKQGLVRLAWLAGYSLLIVLLSAGGRAGGAPPPGFPPLAAQAAALAPTAPVDPALAALQAEKQEAERPNERRFGPVPLEYSQMFLNSGVLSDLSTSFKGAPLSARPGELITYTITLSNSGAGPAGQAWMQDPLPVGISFAYTVTPGLDYNAALDRVEWGGSLEPGEKIDLAFAAQVDPSRACGDEILNQALISDTLSTRPVSVLAHSEIWDNVHLSADFEADDGGFSASGSPSSWTWGAVTPYQGSSFNFPSAAHSGKRVWATNPNGDYGNDEDGYLTSAAIDLRRVPSVPGYPLWLTWWQWLHSESSYDFASVEVRGGAYAHEWESVFGPTSGAVDLAWTRHAVDISRFAGASDFQVRFHFTSDVSIVYAGWYLDDVLLVQCQPPPGLHLTPDTLQASGCNGSAQQHNLILSNLSGAAGSFDLNYTLDSTLGSLSGPAALFLEDGASANFQVTLQPQVCVPDGLSLAASIDAAGNGFSDTTAITKTITTSGAWESQAPLPSGGLYDMAVVEGKNGGLYVLGGSGASTRLNLRYDQASNAWSSGAALPADLRILDGAQIGEEIYLPGGYSGASIVASHLVYHTSSDTWSSAAAAPRPVAGYGAAACGGRLYRVGGGLQATWPNGEKGTEVYDPGSDRWTALAPMLSGHNFPALACLDGKLYVAGGIDQNGSASSVSEVYDMLSNTWSDLEMANLPEARWGAADFVLGGRLYLAGGIVNGAASASVVVYDFEGQAWQAGAPLSEARYRLEGDSGYVMGGMQPAWQPHSANEKLTLCPVCTQRGWLEGRVHDFDGAGAPVAPASVSISPGDLHISVQPSGYYSTSLVPWVYQVEASAEGYPTPVGPWPVTVANGAASQQDFSLPRPDIWVEPHSLSAIVLPPGQNSASFTIGNDGTWPLTFELRELKPVVSQAIPTLCVGTSADTSIETGQEILIEPALLEQINANKAAGGMAPGYLIYLHQRPDLSAAQHMDWQARGRWVVETLQKNAALTQANLRAYLDSQQVEYRAYWIDNVIVVNASTIAAFNGLLAYDEIAALRARRHPMFYEPESTSGYAEALQSLAVQANLTHVGADQVWAQGVLGQGMVVANIDTGVNYTHEALVQSYRGSLGSGLFDHNHNWYDPPGGTQLSAPADWNNHGSHTMGSMLGSTNPANPLAASNTIGMAPGAKWIACRAFEQSDQELLECGQFLAAPTEVDGVTNPLPDLRPHVINNSWGDCTRTYDPWYDGVLDSWHALGIYPVFSNGNASNCGYSYPPGLNTVGSPARAGNVTAVGATGRNNGQYATYSNWGPSDQSDLDNPLGYPRLKPQVVAPGTNYSAGRSGNAYLDMNGTSMAAPHVAGLVALVWSAAPCLVGETFETETILQQSANPIPYPTGGDPPPGPGNVPNYATGWGEINAPAAVQAAIEFCTTDWLPWVTLSPTSGTVANSLASAIQVDFTCSLEDAHKPQPLQGKVRLQHNDPSQAPIDIDLQLYCVGDEPAPTWEKQLWINGQPAASVTGPHIVRPGDQVTILDQVGAISAQPFTATLTETWGAALSLLSYDTDGQGTVSVSEGQLTWQIGPGALPNFSYPITKTFQVQYGDWLQDTLTETYQVQAEQVPSEILHLPPVVVGLERYQPAIQLAKSGPGVVVDGERAAITLTIQSDGGFHGDLTLVDPLPSGMSVVGEVRASFGTAWITSGAGSGSEIHWNASTSPAGSPPLPAIVTIRFMTRFRGSPEERVENIAYLEWEPAPLEQTLADYTSDKLVTYIAGTADLAVALSAAANPVTTGELLTYTLSVENKGPNPVYQATLNDRLPANAGFASASPGCSHSGSTVTCEIERLLPGETRQIRIIVSAPAAPGWIANQASITAVGSDPYTRNNWASLITQVLLRIFLPLLPR